MVQHIITVIEAFLFVFFIKKKKGSITHHGQIGIRGKMMGRGGHDDPLVGAVDVGVGVDLASCFTAACWLLSSSSSTMPRFRFRRSSRRDAI